MTSPTLEGLSALLDKNPIIPTFKARDLLSLPADVEAVYERHVRSYMPIARTTSGDDAVDMVAFEQKLVRMIREARTPIGYVSAEYGHGKTSTGLFLWDRARNSNILAVPPFSLDRLEDLITAVAGWVRLMVERMHPGLGAEAAAIYEAYRTEGVEALARRHAVQFDRPYEQVLAEFRELDQQGKLQANSDGLTYVNFLEAMTALAVKAGYDGLLVVADEVQQYIEHADVSSAVEPIGKLFDLITTLLARTGRLACGLILLLPNKELGLLNQQRGDLVQRMRASRLALDLSQLYGPTFATELWQRLAETFHFADIADRVFDAEALRALGEIAARTDLASGPRTVVDVFKLACEHFRDGAQTPYGLLQMIDSFEQGRVAFDGLSRIQLAVREALVHELVRGNPEGERAVRLMAAFPTTGLSVALQERHGVRAAADDLLRLASGELVAIRGGGYDHTGRAIEAGVTLLALRPTQEQVTWLKGTIRDYRRSYFLGNPRVQRLAANGFQSLLTSRLFPSPQWRVEREFEPTALSQNQGLVLRGAFPSFARRFPERVVYCRILSPNEPEHPVLTPHDLLIDVVLAVPLGSDGEAQRIPGSVSWLDANHVRIELNLLRREPDAIYLELSPGFEDIVAPYEVNPLLTLSLHAHLAATLAAGGIPGAEESNVRDLFLPALHGAAQRDLLTAELGQASTPPVPAADTRFFELLVQLLCERTYSDRYVALMVTGQWRKAIDEYRGALQKLDNPYIQNGTEPFEGPKREVAELLTRTNATLDNFIQSFPQLIRVEAPFRGDAPGRVRFTLHPLEQRIIQLAQSGQRVPRLNPRTRQAMEVPTIAVSDVQRALSADGYRLTEVEAGLVLLESRRMIDWDQRTGTIALSEPDVPALDVVNTALAALQRRLTTLKPILNDAAARIIDTNIARLQSALAKPDRPPRGNELLAAQRLVEQNVRTLEDDLAQQRRRLQEQGAGLLASAVGDANLGEYLVQPLDGSLFAGQLDAVRLALAKEVQALAQQSTAVRTAADEVLAVLARGAETDGELVQMGDRLKQASSSHAAVVLRRDQLQRSVADYRAATQLLDQARELLIEKLTPLGESVETQRAALRRWSTEITGQLSAHRAQALEQTPVWQAEFGEIKRQVSTFEQSNRETFLARQQELRAILSTEFGLREELLPRPLAFNPADPEESRRLLCDQIRTALTGIRTRLLGQLERVTAMARDQRQVEKLALLPIEQRSRAATDMQNVEQQTQQLAEQAAAAFTDLIQSVDDAESTSLREQAKAAVALVAPSAALLTRIQTLTQLLQAIALTPEEERANNILIELAAGATIDYGAFELRLQQELQGVDPWLILRGLMRKSRARLRVEVIGG